MLKTASFAELVSCPLHGDACASVLVDASAPRQCLECCKYLKLVAYAAPAHQPIRVTRKMLIVEPHYKCDVCGGPVSARTKSGEEWTSLKSIFWTLRDDAQGLSTMNNLIPMHFACWRIMGPNQVSDRENSLGIWSRVQSKSEVADSPVPPQVCSRKDYNKITRQLSELKLRHVERFQCDSDLTETDLVHAWYSAGGRCALTGDTINLFTKITRLRLSWDRISSSEGYVRGNVVPTTWESNSAKTTQTVPECLRVYRDALRGPHSDVLPHVDISAAEHADELTFIDSFSAFIKPKVQTDRQRRIVREAKQAAQEERRIVREAKRDTQEETRVDLVLSPCPIDTKLSDILDRVNALFTRDKRTLYSPAQENTEREQRREAKKRAREEQNQKTAFVRLSPERKTESVGEEVIIKRTIRRGKRLIVEFVV